MTLPADALSRRASADDLGAAVRSFDWRAADAACAPFEHWPPSVRAAVDICLASPLGLMVLVGPSLRCIYNQAAMPMTGAEHAGAIGLPLAQVWPGAGVIASAARSVLETGAAVREEDAEVTIERDGFLVQSYFTLACSPLPADAAAKASAPAGVLVALVDTTARVLNERRQRTLNDLATGVALRRGDAAILERVREVLAHNPIDLPLAALYLDSGSGHAAQRFCTGLHEGCAGVAKRVAWGVAADHPLSRLADSFDAMEFDAADLLTPQDSCGTFPEQPKRLLALPFMAPGHGRPIGFLLVALNPRAYFDADYRHFIDTIVAVVATAVASVEAERLAEQEELKMLYQRLQAVREAERSALAREVHDQLGQTLSAAKIDLKLLQAHVAASLEPVGTASGATVLEPRRIVAELQTACDTLDRAVGEVRDIAKELRAPELDVQGLYAAIEWHGRDFEKRTRIGVHIALAAGLAAPPRPMSEAMLRIVQEALTNVLRHAKARQVWISIDVRGSALLLRIRDDGVGIGGGKEEDARTWRDLARGSLGITGMRERAALAGGRLTVRALRPRGTLVSALLPLPASPRGWLRNGDGGGTGVGTGAAGGTP